MTDKEGWVIFERAMTMLEDVPGETLLERIARLKEWYLEIQFLVGKLKNELEIARAVNRLTLSPADRNTQQEN